MHNFFIFLLFTFVSILSTLARDNKKTINPFYTKEKTTFIKGHDDKPPIRNYSTTGTDEKWNGGKWGKDNQNDDEWDGDKWNGGKRNDHTWNGEKWSDDKWNSDTWNQNKLNGDKLKGDELNPDELNKYKSIDHKWEEDELNNDKSKLYKSKDDKSKDDKSKEYKSKEYKSKGDKSKDDKDRDYKFKDKKSKDKKSKDKKSKDDKCKDDKSKDHKWKEDKLKGYKYTDDKSKDDKYRDDISKDSKSNDDTSKVYNYNDDKSEDKKSKDKKAKDKKCKDKKCKEDKSKDHKWKEDELNNVELKGYNYNDDKSKDDKSKDDKSKDDKSKDDKSKVYNYNNDISKDDKSKNDKSKDDKSKDDTSKVYNYNNDISKDDKSKDDKSKDDKSKDDTSKDDRLKADELNNELKEYKLKGNKWNNDNAKAKTKDIKENASLENIKTKNPIIADNQANTYSTLNMHSEMDSNNLFIEKQDANSKTFTDKISENIKKLKGNAFANIFSNIYSYIKNDYRKYYHIKLKEENFRWSLPLYIGSQKNLHYLHIVTSVPHTTLYCSLRSNNGKNASKLKYELTTSEDGKLTECKSESCEALTKKKPCQPLYSFLPNLRDYIIKRKKCERRFCDHVHNISFLSLEKITDNKDVSLCSFNYSVGYDNIKGFYFSDSFYIQNASLQFYNYFGCITESDDLKLNNNNSGFIGLSNYDVNESAAYPSIVNQFIDTSLSKQNIFAICLVENGGFITFGGYESSIIQKKENIKPNEKRDKDINDIVWINYFVPNQDSFILYLNEISIHKDKNTKINSIIKQEVIVDSYNYFLSLPHAAVTKIKTAIQNVCQLSKNANCRNIHENGILTITNGTVKDYPKLELRFNEKIVFIEPNDYIIKMSATEYKILINESNVPKLGIPFFLNKYIIFDNIQKKLGVGRSKCNLKISVNDSKGIDLSPKNKTVDAVDDTHVNDKKSFFEKHKIVIISGIIISIVFVIFAAVAYFFK